MARTGTQENQQANQQLQTQQAESYGKTNASIDKYNADLTTLKGGQNIAENPFGTSTYLSNLNRLFATTADATANAGKEKLENYALRTGDNSAAIPATIRNISRDTQRVANAGQAEQYATDYGRNLDWQTALMNADLAPTGASNSSYGTATGGRSAALKNLADIGNASYGPWNAAIGAAGAAIGAACPVEGSMILMADGSEKPIEELVAGDLILGPDGQSDEVISNDPSRQECVEVKSADGKSTRASESHALIRHFGGYVFAKDALNNIPLNHDSVVCVNPIGQRRVFHPKLKRAHAYRADRFWALE